MGDNHSDLFFSSPILQRSSTSFFKTASCDIGTGYGFVWYGLESGCTSMSTCLVSQVTKG